MPDQVPNSPPTHDQDLKEHNVAKLTFRSNPVVKEIFDDLERYQEFCRDFGYRYNEADLYNWKSYAFQQFNKHLQGKPAKDMWPIDNRRGR